MFNNIFEISNEEENYFQDFQDYFNGAKCTKHEHHDWKVIEKKESGFPAKISCIYCNEVHICGPVGVPASTAKISYKMPIYIPKMMPSFLIK